LQFGPKRITIYNNLSLLNDIQAYDIIPTEVRASC